jgi:hypothetical protein
MVWEDIEWRGAFVLTKIYRVHNREMLISSCRVLTGYVLAGRWSVNP